MPAFNIPCSHKYLVIRGIDKWEKTNSFKQAKKIVYYLVDEMHEIHGVDRKKVEVVVYEKVGSGKRADWYPLVDYYNEKFDTLVLGDLPVD